MNKVWTFLVRNKYALGAAAVTLLIGAATGYWLGGLRDTGSPAAASAERKVLFYRNPMNPAITSPVPAKDEMGMDYIPVYAEEDKPAAERKILFYRNPMNPAITSPVPAKDEMGMDYIPVYADDGDAEAPGTVKIDPVVAQNIGVRTDKAELRTLARTVRTVGRVDYDEEHLARLHPKVEGWIAELYINKTGERVKHDTILLNIYSPQLVTSQQEYLLALKNLKSLQRSPFKEIREGAMDLVKTSRERLEMLDVPEHQIRELEQTEKIKKNLHIHSPFAGVVTHIGAREGEYVTPKTELYTIADLSNVWVYADIYEDELPWIKVGDEAQMELAGIPGKVFRGHISYIYPYADPKTRTIKVRMVFDNPDQLLKPDMFADVEIAASREIHAVVVPAEAVIRSGTRNQVFVVRGPGKFEPREVKVGVMSDGLVQILDGVSAGEQVVTSSQFLIDSESKLREATAKMREAGSAETDDKQHDHTGHTGMDTPAAAPDEAITGDHQHMDHGPADSAASQPDSNDAAGTGHEHMSHPPATDADQNTSHDHTMTPDAHGNHGGAQ